MDLAAALPAYRRGGEIEASGCSCSDWLRPGPARTAGARLYAADGGPGPRRRRSTRASARRIRRTDDSRSTPCTCCWCWRGCKRRGRRPRATRQALFDAYLSGLDHGLRELAVGDLSVGKTMRQLGEAFYGRGQALDAAMAALPDRGAAGRPAAAHRAGGGAERRRRPAPLADYVLRVRAALAATPAERLLAGEIDSARPFDAPRRACLGPSGLSISAGRLCPAGREHRDGLARVRW